MPLQYDFAQAESYLWSSEGMYALALVREGVLADYHVFTPPPQSIEQALEPGTFVQPTQGNDMYVEGLGLQSKTIRISATSAVFGKRSPFDSSVALPPEAARSAGVADSGYSLFHKLQKLYVQYQKEVSGSGGIFPSVTGKPVELHFFNLKDGEFYHVEPGPLRVSRQVGKPLQYLYTVEMRVLRSSRFGRWASALAAGLAFANFALYYEKLSSLTFLYTSITHDFYDFFASVRSTFLNEAVRVARAVSRFKEITDMLGSTFWQKNLYDPASDDQPSWAASVSAKQVHREIYRASQTGNVPLPFIRDPDGVHQYVPTAQRMLGALAPMYVVTSGLISEFAATRDVWPAPGVDLLDPAYDAYGKCVECEIEQDIVIANAPVIEDGFSDGPTDFFQDAHAMARRGEGDVDDAVREEMTSVQAALNVNRGATSDYPVAYGAMRTIRKWPGALEAVVPTSYSAYLQRMGVTDPRTYSGLYRREVVLAVDDIRSFAQRVLGDWHRWMEVVLINNLKWPYFTPDGIPGTVAYGESILVPTADPVLSVQDVTMLEAAVRRYDKLNKRDIYLGLDAQLGSDGDWVLDGRGERAMVAGADAYAQNLITRLSTEVGRYIPLNTYGVGIRVGEKPTSLQLHIWRAMLMGAIKSDSRVTEVTRLLLTISQNVVTYDIRVLLRELDEAITASGTLVT